MMLSEMYHSFRVTKRGWTKLIIFYFIVSGTCSLVTVHQPPVIMAVLGQDLILPCNLDLSLSPGEKMLTPPVLYWFHLAKNTSDPPKLWGPTEKYAGRVKRMDNNPYSSDMSILFRDVQWADSGKYLCKVSVNTNRDSFRRNGNQTLLLLSDAMIFDPISDSLLRCEINVSHDPGLVFSIFHDGVKLQPIDSAPGEVKETLHYFAISETISLEGEGEYECQLHLNEHVVTVSFFYYYLNVIDDGADAGKNVTCATTVSEPRLGLIAEPWFLYGAVLLVPVLTLLALLAALLIYRVWL